MFRLINRTAWLFAMVGGFVASLVAVMTVASIAGRALVSAPIQGDFELTQLGIAVCISLCLPWCQVHGANIIVDFFTQKAQARTQQAMDGVGALMLAAMAGVLAWRTAAGAMAVSEAGETSMILSLPGWWVYAFLAPGLALTCLIALVQAALLFGGRDVSEMKA